jgi:predicted PurR-regulated permease PerM
MKVKIEIDTQTFVRFWLVVIGFVLTGLAIVSAQVALIIIGVSLFFALALNVPVTKISRHLPGKSRTGATAIAYFGVVLVISSLFFLVVPAIIDQSVRTAQNFPQLVESSTRQWTVVNEFIDNAGLQPQVDQALTTIKDTASSWATSLSKGVVTGIGSVFGFIAATILVLVLIFLMLVEGPMWTKRLWSVYNNEAKMIRHRRIADKMYTVFTGYVTGQLTVSAIGGSVAGLFIFILSLIFPSVPAGIALPAAAITFLLSMIPMFGATIGGVLITILLVLNQPVAAIVYLVFFVVYQQIENNLISPRIQSKKIDLPALAVLVAVTIGLFTFGVVGGIIAIPIAGCIRVLVEEHLATAREHRLKPEHHDADLAPDQKEAFIKKISKTSR